MVEPSMGAYSERYSNYITETHEQFLLKKLYIITLDNNYHCFHGRFVAPLIPTDWAKECGITSANQVQVITKSTTQESESILMKSVTLDNIMIINSPLPPYYIAVAVPLPPYYVAVALGVLFSISVIALIVVSTVLGLVCYEKNPRYQSLNTSINA